MKTEYQLKQMKAIKNPYINKVSKKIKINISNEALQYFRSIADEKNIPIETLISFYLLDCARSGKKL